MCFRTFQATLNIGLPLLYWQWTTVQKFYFTDLIEESVCQPNSEAKNILSRAYCLFRTDLLEYFYTFYDKNH